VDLELVKRLLASTKASSMGAFLAREFDNVSKALAGVFSLCKYCQPLLILTH
jgi:hypothetical protein